VVAAFVAITWATGDSTLAGIAARGLKKIGKREIRESVNQNIVAWW